MVDELNIRIETWKILCAEKKGSLVSTQKSGFRRNNWLVQCGGLTAHCTCNCHNLTSFFERTPGLVSGGPPEDERGGRGDHGPGMVNNSKLFLPKLALVVVYFGRAHPNRLQVYLCHLWKSLLLHWKTMDHAALWLKGQECRRVSSKQIWSVTVSSLIIFTPFFLPYLGTATAW